MSVGVNGTAIQAVNWQRQWTAIFTTIFLFSSFSVTIFSHKRSARIKKLIQRKLTVVPKNLRLNTLPDTAAILLPPSGHLVFYRQCGIAGTQQVPLALGWYFECYLKTCNLKILGHRLRLVETQQILVEDQDLNDLEDNQTYTNCDTKISKMSTSKLTKNCNTCLDRAPCDSLFVTQSGKADI